MKTIKGKHFVRLISEDAIEIRIKSLANQINEEYEGKSPLFLAILNGSFMFAAALFRHLEIEASISFIKVKSYEYLASTGNTQELIGLSEKLEGRDIIILEDIVDTGQTLFTVLPEVEKKQPNSVKIMTLLHKPTAAIQPIQPDYVGFSIEPDFVIGYGLDYDGLGRNLPDIMVLAQE